MPELPEVETIVRDLRPHIVGKTLLNPKLHHAHVLRGVTKRRLLRAMTRSRVPAVERRAKHVVIHLSTGDRLVIQPRMTGSLVVHAGQRTPAERRYAVLEVDLEGGGRLVFRDVRRLGTIWLLDEPGWRVYTQRIGPEPLAADFDSTRFANRLNNSRQAIKKVLMDQRRLAGIGNIYANEALYRARLDPSRPAHHVSKAEYQSLYRHLRAVLREAIRDRGTTVRDYRTGTGQSGGYQRVLRVYGRGGEPCRRCGTLLATTHAIDGRATTFCWRCQGRSS